MHHTTVVKQRATSYKKCSTIGVSEGNDQETYLKVNFATPFGALFVQKLHTLKFL